MSDIKAFESLSGRISGDCTLSGMLSCTGSLVGKISARRNFESYTDDYKVIPNAFNAQILPTADKLLTQDILIEKIPYYETSNIHEGITVYIAGEEN